MLNFTQELVSQEVPYQILPVNDEILITVKRIDKVHKTISGNKFYKLKYNLACARNKGCTELISFGGAYSNHIFALAHAAHECGMKSIGIIRGHELVDKPRNKTLSMAESLGMRLQFVTREEYRNKHMPEYLSQLKQQYPNAYVIPEGGSNDLAVQGAEEILNEYDRQNFECICCAVGTGGTISGIINASNVNQKVIGFSALNSIHQIHDIKKWTNKQNWSIYPDNMFGGYARSNDELIEFISRISNEYALPLERIYTGKAMYFLLNLIKNKNLRYKNILFIHTGGLQILL